jgi:hypothetical protein
MMNQAQGRVIDPILTTFVRGYSNNEFVAPLLFPDVDVPVSGGQVIEFGKEHFLLVDTQRAPGGATKRVELGYLGKPYACENHALEALVPDELGRDASIVPGINLAQESVGMTYDIMLLKREYQAAQVARNPNNYAASNKVALAGTTLWTAATGTPTDDVNDARSAIRSKIGKYPNIMILPPGGITKLGARADIKDQFKYTSAQSITAAMLAQYFQVETVVEGNAVYTTGANGALGDVWGNDVILAYAPPNFRSMRVPSYGYTYRLSGHPNVKTPYRDENRESWVYGVKYERTPVIAGADAGFLIQNAF